MNDRVLPDVRPARSIRWKLAAAFMAVAAVMAAFAAMSIAIHLDSVERVVQLEAEHVAGLIADGAIEDEAFRPYLQDYVVRLSLVLKRDVVIVDARQVGIADADADELGARFDHDPGDEVGKTIADGRTRTFVETNAHHPRGVYQIVVALRQNPSDHARAPIGALILEYTPIRDELFAAQRKVTGMIAAAGVAVVVLVALFGLGFSRRITQPLRELKDSVQRIAKDSSVRFAVTSRDEIGVLGLAFNKMAEDLSVSHAGLVERAEYLSRYDALTGLANQSLFRERLAKQLLATGGSGRIKAICVLDIERFRTINDAFGRKAGDELLKQVAQRILQVGGGDALRYARIGPDRFGIASPDTDTVEQAGRLLRERLDATFRGPFRVAGDELRVAAKVGVAIFPDDGADPDTLLHNAEAALRKAKVTGEPFVFFTHAMTERVAERLSLENDLRQALEKNEFVLHYQPRVNVASRKLTGAEALIRWNDPRRGLVPPMEFIPILEETGLIHDVGRWALREAVEACLRWRKAGLAGVRVAVNVSPLQLRDRGFITEVEQATAIDTHAAAALKLEITESVIMADVEHSIASLQAIRALGVIVALDDFGAGYSSLSHLSRLPVDTLQIDRSFVAAMTTSPAGLALVSTFITLAHSLELKVVAKGVETEEQSRLLRLLSCDEMQGHLVGKAVPGEIFEARFLAALPA